MLVKSSAKVIGLIAFALVVCLGSLLGVVSFLLNLEENKCDMTYMYEFPQYTRISISPETDLKYKHYSLNAYSEGVLTKHVREMRFLGIPVLFIPGHSGSGKQVRSIASVAFRKAVDESHLQYFFDFFAVDFNGEYSALFGGVLEAQTEYVLHSLHKILKLYPSNRQPGSVLIIGHSMGGMIAKGLYLQEGFDPGMISTIITLATPHQPVILLDPYLNDYYTKVNNFWSKYYSPYNTSIVSIGGGNADIHVKAALTKTDHVNICTSSSMVPAVWVSADHKSIVWCKRLIKVLVRVLFDFVDPQSKHVTSSVQHRNNVLKYHLSERFGGKSYRVAQNLGSQIFNPEGDWLEYASLQDTLEYRSGVRQSTHILIKILPLSSNPQHEMMVLDTLNVPGDHWLYACSATEFDGKKKFCQVGENLSGGARFLPSIKGKHLRTYLPLQELRVNKHTHVLITVPPYHEYFRISYDIYRPRDRLSRFPLISPSIIPLPFSPSPLTLSLSHDRPSLSHTLVLDGMQYVWLALRFRVIPHCDKHNPHHQSVATVHVPWSNQDSYHVIWANTSSHVFPVTLFEPRPPGCESKVTIHFDLDPSCRYLVTAQFSLSDSLRGFIFSYSPTLLSHVAAILLFLLAHQLSELGEQASCSVFPLGLVQSAGSPAFVFRVWCGVVAVVQLGGYLMPRLPSFLLSDTSKLYSQLLDVLVVPVILYAMALSIVVVTGSVGLVSIVLWGKTVNTLAVSFLAKVLKGSTLYSEWTMKIFEKLPGVVAALMLSIAYNTCGGLALALGLCLYFLKLVLLYEEIFERILFLPWNVLKRYLINRLKRYKTSRRAIDENNRSNAKQSNALEDANAQTLVVANTGRNTIGPQNEVTDAFEGTSTLEQPRWNGALTNESLETTSFSQRNNASTKQQKAKSQRPSTSKEDKQAKNSRDKSGRKNASNQSASQDTECTKNNRSVLATDSESSEQSVVKSDSKSIPQSDLVQADSVPRSDSENVDAPERPIVVRSDSSVEDDEVTFRDLNFHFTLFLLWLVCALVSFPSTLVWAKNFGDTMQLSPDPMSTYAIIMSICAALLWQADLPKPDANYYSLVSSLVSLSACYVLLYAQTSLYRLLPAICFVFVIICSHQTITSVFRLRKPTGAEEDTSDSDADRSENDLDREDHRGRKKFRVSHFTSVARSEEFVRDLLDSQLNCIYKRLVRPFRNLVCGAQLQGDNGDEIVSEREREDSGGRENTRSSNRERNVLDGDDENDYSENEFEENYEGETAESDFNAEVAEDEDKMGNKLIAMVSEKSPIEIDKTMDRIDRISGEKKDLVRIDSHKRRSLVRENSIGGLMGDYVETSVEVNKSKTMDDTIKTKENRGADIRSRVENERETKIRESVKEITEPMGDYVETSVEVNKSKTMDDTIKTKENIGADIRSRVENERETKIRESVKEITEITSDEIGSDVKGEITESIDDKMKDHLKDEITKNTDEKLSDRVKESSGKLVTQEIVNPVIVSNGRNKRKLDSLDREPNEPRSATKTQSGEGNTTLNRPCIAAKNKRKFETTLKDVTNIGVKSHVATTGNEKSDKNNDVEEVIPTNELKKMEMLRKELAHENESIGRVMEGIAKALEKEEASKKTESSDTDRETVNTLVEGVLKTSGLAKNVSEVVKKSEGTTIDRDRLASVNEENNKGEHARFSEIIQFSQLKQHPHEKLEENVLVENKTSIDKHDIVENNEAIEQNEIVMDTERTTLMYGEQESTNIEIVNKSESCDVDEEEVDNADERVDKQVENPETKSSRNKRKRRNRKKKGNALNVENTQLGESSKRNKASGTKNEGNAQDDVEVNVELLTDVINEFDLDKVVTNDSDKTFTSSNSNKTCDTESPLKRNIECEINDIENFLVHESAQGNSRATSSGFLGENIERQAYDDASSTDSKQSSNDTGSSFCELSHADVEENASEIEE